MNLHAFDPLEDTRWAAFIASHPSASVYHTVGWLRALRHTYGFAPIAFTTSPPGAALENALLFCGVRSWLTGARLVSLPFSDHCEPLVRSEEELHLLCRQMAAERHRGSWRYVELRPATPVPPPEGFAKAQTFKLHRLDLRDHLDVVAGRFHRDSIRRKIRRAEREALTYEEGRSEVLLQQFYRLLEMTRERHGVPPQPMAWFRNLVRCLGEALCIRVAYKHGDPVAGILTLTHRDRLVYKYGGSDARRHALGGVPFVFWQTIQNAKRRGFSELDLGRSDEDNLGLIAFKDHWGADRSTLTYWRSPGSASRGGWSRRMAKHAITRVPAGIRRAIGRLLYRHMG